MVLFPRDSRSAVEDRQYGIERASGGRRKTIPRKRGWVQSDNFSDFGFRDLQLTSKQIDLAARSRRFPS